MDDAKAGALMTLGMATVFIWLAHAVAADVGSTKPNTLKWLRVAGCITGLPVLLWAYSVVILG